MYPYAYIYRGQRTILIWQSNNIDTFKITSDSRLLQYRTLSTMKRKLKTAAAKIHWAEYAEIDYHKFFTALKNLRAEKASSAKTCYALLEGWNFIEDMSRTFNLKKDLKRLRSRLLNKSYEKLFYGCNLPSVTPEGKSYSPLWTTEEISAMRAEFRAIWATLRKKGYIQP